MSAAAPGQVRVHARVHGTVQGVGFRPYVFRLAEELGLDGHVLNDAAGVEIEVEGDESSVGEFLNRLPGEAPPLAVVESVQTSQRPLSGTPGFAIRASPRGAPANAPVTPDTAVCEECLRELFDPHDRRHGYPFINCTNCGPRFTIVRAVPYDRPYTTMAGFLMCPECRDEYDDPRSRRFHAQPNACSACGPSLSLLDAQGRSIGGEALPAAASLLLAGGIVAVKGIGGYHLACRADDEDAVSRLRSRKHRDERPFALMVASTQSARALVELESAEERLLTSPARPIVLARRRSDAPVAASVALRAPELGVMLAYSPLHHLLLHECGVPLVMTSGNLSEEPIAYADDDALERLAEIADALLIHDRPIQTRTDDSVVRVISVPGGHAPLAIRRSRGYVPSHLRMPVAAARPLLACGAEQKNTFCVVKDERAWVSHHVGDLEHSATYRAYREGVGHFERLFAVAPDLVAHDLHPGYLSTQFALEYDGVEQLAVQHHHAHLAACLAEHRLTERALGAIFDGTGYGSDGTVWGGEFLAGDLRGFERLGHLRPVPLPGGVAAIREPWRMAFAWLADAFDAPQPRPPALAGGVDERSWQAMAKVSQMAEVSPVTTSLGRLCDAVGALCLGRARASYEGQAAVELEAAASAAHGRSVVEVELIRTSDGALTLDPRSAIREIAHELGRGMPVEAVAAGFHEGLIRATARACAELASAAGLDTVVLSGGVFQNRILIEGTTRALARAGLRVLLPTALPPNDAAISFGQAAVAAARMESRG